MTLYTFKEFRSSPFLQDYNKKLRKSLNPKRISQGPSISFSQPLKAWLLGYSGSLEIESAQTVFANAPRRSRSRRARTRASVTTCRLNDDHGRLQRWFSRHSDRWASRFPVRNVVKTEQIESSLWIGGTTAAGWLPVAGLFECCCPLL